MTVTRAPRRTSALPLSSSPAGIVVYNEVLFSILFVRVRIGFLSLPVPIDTFLAIPGQS
jgi:hypothetical protein